MKAFFLLLFLTVSMSSAICQRPIKLPGGSKVRADRTTPPPAPNDTLYVVLVGGQSNADNRDALPSPVMAADSTVPGVKLWDNDSGYFRTLKYGTYAATGSTSDRFKWGFSEVALKYLIDSTSRDNLRILKVTLGNTAMALDGASAGSWYTPSLSVTVGARMFLRVQQRYPTMMTYVNGEGHPVRVLAVLWHQGEGDYTTPNSTTYETNMTNLIAAYRTLTGNANLPFIFGTVSNLSGQYGAVVNAAQHNIDATIPNTYLIDMAGQTLFDGLHFDAGAATYFGHEVFKILRAIN